jgi:hypothetical protein
MTPLKALIGLVALLFDRFFPPKTYAWPDGEQPLIDHHPADYPEDWGLRWDGDSLISAGDGSATEACVEPTAEGPGGAGVRSPAPPGATNVEPVPCAHPFGYDHPCAKCGHTGGNIHVGADRVIAPRDCSCDNQTDAYLYYPGHHPDCVSQQRPNVTAGLLIAAAYGLREFVASDDCEAPNYWRSIAEQIDPK